MYIDGKEMAESVAEKLRSNFSALSKERKENGERPISLGIFMVGDDAVIQSFVNIKKRFAEKVGVEYNIFQYKENISEEEFLRLFQKEQKNADGVIVQLPLPKKFNTKRVLSCINKEKDVDLLNPKNIEKNILNNMSETKNDKIFAPVSGAIFKIIQSVEYNLEGKKIVIVGKGKLTGEPFSDDLKNRGFEDGKDFFFIDIDTDENTKKELLKSADIIISGVGIPNLIQKKDIKDGIFLIDAGTSTANKKLVGDISLDCIEKAEYFSKTPGGVGPVTVAVLYENLWKLVLARSEKKGT